jgi:hypothetical protein
MPIDGDDEVVAVDSEHSSGAAARLSLVFRHGDGISYWHEKCAAEQLGSGARKEAFVKPARGWSGRILDWSLFGVAVAIGAVPIIVYDASKWVGVAVMAAVYVMLAGAVFLFTGRLPISADD